VVQGLGLRVDGWGMRNILVLLELVAHGAVCFLYIFLAAVARFFVEISDSWPTIKGVLRGGNTVWY
jgi:prolipoprotein diacylglyceryltransferase